MPRAPELAVTLSPALFDRLSAEADRLGISLVWLVAGLVLDTLGDDGLGTTGAKRLAG